ncbi:MAG: NYN domain-containing protein [Desulfosarcinaceae bacterium]
MALHIIIDGYNLIRNSSTLKELDRLDLKQGRDALVDLLAAYKKIKAHRITVVFDGMDAPVYASKREQVRGITIRFSRAGETADSVIKRMAAREREKALIVSSDREVVQAAEASHAATIGAADFEFKLLLADADGAPPSENGSPHSLTTKKKGPSRRASRRERRNRRKTLKL